MPIGDYIASGLRTFVSWLWGILVTWLLDAWTTAPEAVAEWLESDLTYAGWAALAAAGWYGFWRWFEPKLPAWARRFTLGSAKRPGQYTRPA